MKFVISTTRCEEGRLEKNTRLVIEEIERRRHSCLVVDPVNTEILTFDNEVVVKNNGRTISNCDVLYVKKTAGEEKSSYELARAMEMVGVTVVDPPHTLVYATDKMLNHIKRVKAGIPMPPSAFINKVDEDTPQKMRGAKIYKPYILKPNNGCRARGVRKFKSIHTVKRFDGMENLIFQKRLRILNKFRVLVINGESYGAWSQGRSHNEERLERNYVRNEEIERLALRVAEIDGLDICGVDIVDTPNGLYVLKNNRNCGTKVFSEISGINVASKIVDFLIKKHENNL